jgi:outer membrane biosynthesis protein TonB
LREGDPAAGEALTPEEVRAMRRAVLTAVPEPRRRSFLVPLMAGAAALLAVVVALALWRARTEPVVEKPPVVAAVPAPPVRPPQPPVVEETPEPVPPPVPIEREVPRRVVPRPEPVPEAPVLPEATDTLASSPVEEPESRQIQFSTPGGTRIIWVLTSDETL